MHFIPLSEKDSYAEHIVHRADGVCRVVPDLVVKVDDRVGVPAEGLVYHVLDVYVFLRYQVEFVILPFLRYS